MGGNWCHFRNEYPPSGVSGLRKSRGHRHGGTSSQEARCVPMRQNAQRSHKHDCKIFTKGRYYYIVGRLQVPTHLSDETLIVRRLLLHVGWSAFAAALHGTRVQDDLQRPNKKLHCPRIHMTPVSAVQDDRSNRLADKKVGHGRGAAARDTRLAVTTFASAIHQSITKCASAMLAGQRSP